MIMKKILYCKISENKMRNKKFKKDFFESYDYSKLTSTTPICPHFGECGGCSFQNILYTDQIKIKEEYLNDLFKRIISQVKNKPQEKIIVTPSPIQLEYRNRMDFAYTQGKLGFRKRGNYKELVDVNECYLMPEFAREIYTLIREKLIENKILDYDFLEHKGFLRYVGLRYSIQTKETMIILNSTTPQTEELKNLFEKIILEIKSNEKIKENIKTIYWFHYDSITDVSIPNIDPYKIYGKENIIDEIGDKKYLVSPFSFFQVNTQVAKIIFDKIKEQTIGNVVDLCCGVGAITIYISEKSTSTIGIEEIKQAIDLAKENKLLNKELKSHFFVDNMKNFSQYAPLEIDTLIIDPPRMGVGKKIVQKIIDAEPKKIIYMSCNPKTQKSDLHLLLESQKYNLIFLQGWDMFPQTPHVETLLILELIN
jgi:23S rRNA (uracil1939-C5)-methyltransferase